MILKWGYGVAAVSDGAAAELIRGVYRPDEVIEIGTDQGTKVEWHRSRITSLGEDPLRCEMTVVCPMGADGMPHIHTGQRVLVFFCSEGSGYAFETHVLKLGREHGVLGSAIVSARLGPPETLYHFQRREALRVVPRSRIEVTTNWPRGDGSGEPVTHVGIMEDISVSGVRVRIDHFDISVTDDLIIGMTVDLAFTIPSKSTDWDVETEAQLARFVREIEPRKALWLGMRWARLAPADQRHISDFVMNTERETMRIHREAVEVRGRERRP